jgi:hypothetical protein
MQTRRRFFGAAAAALVAASGAVSAVADGTATRRERTYIRMQYRANTYPASVPVGWRTPDAPTEFVVVCEGANRQDLVKFVHAMRDVVWLPKLRRKASSRAVQRYMDAYDHMVTCIHQCKTSGEYQLLYYTNFLVDCTPDLPAKLLEYDVVLHDGATNTVMRRFKTATKRGRTTTREVVRTEG